MLAKLDGPNKVDLYFLKEWFERDSMGAFPILGPDMDAWNHAEDLIALKPRSPQDPTSSWFTTTIFPLYHRLVGQKVKVRSRTPCDQVKMFLQSNNAGPYLGPRVP